MGKCAVPGCERKLYGITYCERHYRQLLRYGKILDRTIVDLNKIEIKEDYCEMEVYNRQHQIVGMALFDKEDYDLVSKYSWHRTTKGYVRNAKLGYLHNAITGFKFQSHKIQTDHINRNKMDCRKSNLRIVDHTENNINRDLQRNNKSGCKGVSWDLNRQKWISRITRNHKEHFLGAFIILEDAISARRKAEKELHAIKNRPFTMRFLT